jgi:ribosomal protein S25
LAYNNKNFLERIVEIQNLTIEQTRRGVSQAWVYRNVIAPRYRVSESTYYKYLARNVKRELKDAETRHAAPGDKKELKEF